VRLSLKIRRTALEAKLPHYQQGWPNEREEIDGVSLPERTGVVPIVHLIEQSRLAVDELIDVAGRATIETVLQLSAEQVAGPRTPGRRKKWVGTAANENGCA
jgi:hypothetical protein